MLEDTGAPANIHFNTGAPCDVVEVIPRILAERRFEVGRIDTGRIRHAEVVGERHAANRLGVVRHAVVVEPHLEQAPGAALVIGAGTQRNPTGGGRDFPNWCLGGIPIGASDPLWRRRRRCLEAKKEEDERQERDLHGKLFPRLLLLLFRFCELLAHSLLDEALFISLLHDMTKS